MSSPRSEQFEEFFHAVYGKSPFPWQKRLAKRVCGGDWPRAIALPTAAGKTACIDIAVFALACCAKNAPRRIFFVVDRRIVVDQAYEHAKKLAKVLLAAKSEKSGILKQVAESLCEIAQDERPLDVYALRGGMYRESAWARSPLQPLVIASTVDQVGSRLLFRGYGVSDSMKPVHAGLVGNDSLILLDEAHCAKPFDQTMQAIKSYRTWQAEDAPPQAAFHFVSITATPAGEVPEDQIERDDEKDRAHAVLGKRIAASKPATLVVAEKAKGKNGRAELVKKLEEHAKKLAAEFPCVGVIVNRVATARELAQKLGNDAVLLTGRMRPLDRDRIFNDKLQSLLSGATGTPPKFVVGTQCLECGADFDFHAMVTECASLDALRQRFGRLNRVAARPSAKAVIVVRGDQTEPEDKEENADPVYGNSLANTWQWLKANAKDDVFDFGVSAVREATTGVDLTLLNAPSVDAPVLFPAHLDCWVQTNPIPTPNPDPALFLHGPKQPGVPDVQVVFRSDLGEKSEKWLEIVSLCPPSSSEAVPVPISVFKKWLAGELVTDDTADVEGVTPDTTEDDDKEQPRQALRWRGPSEERSAVVSIPKEVTPNDTYVVSCSAEGINALGDFISTPPADYAEEAFQRSRDKVVLRLPNLTIPEDADKQQETELLATAIEELLSDDSPEWRRLAVEHFSDRDNLKRREVDAHPLGGFVVKGKDRLRQFDPTYLDDTEPDESFRGQRKGARAVLLQQHAIGVAEYATRFAQACNLETDLYTQAGLWHDLGKLDPRFQAMLKESSPRTAMFIGEPWAKSGGWSGTKEQKKQAREVHKYPVGARHELLSAALVATKFAPENADDLLLHLIATHHGSARPFASAVNENDEVREPFTAKLFNETFSVSTSAQQIRDWNAELPERFWRVVRKYGWWGSAYREAVFRLADHAQSAAEQEQGASTDLAAAVATGWVAFPAKAIRRERHPLPLVGLDGSNPLAFLAALGTLRLADRAVPGTCLSWELRGAWTPVLHLPEKWSEAELISLLMTNAGTNRKCMSFAEDLKIVNEEFRTFQNEARQIARKDREFADALCAYADPLVTIQAGPNAGKTRPTEFYFIAGLQRLLEIARNIATRTTSNHLHKCLFSQWLYDDPVEKLSFRWDPQDDSRYATRWRNPSGDPTRKRGGSILGANRLALEGMLLFPCFPRGEKLVTTGFLNINRRVFFTWPIWTPTFGVDAVRSLFGTLESPRTAETVELILPREHLAIVAWYQCEKVPNSDYSNFSQSRVV